MPTGEEVRAVPPQNVSPSALGLEVEEIYLPSGRGRSVSLDIPLYRTGHLITNPEWPVPIGEFCLRSASSTLVTTECVLRPFAPQPGYGKKVTVRQGICVSPAQTAPRLRSFTVLRKNTESTNKPTRWRDDSLQAYANKRLMRRERCSTYLYVKYVTGSSYFTYKSYQNKPPLAKNRRKSPP